MGNNLINLVLIMCKRHLWFIVFVVQLSISSCLSTSLSATESKTKTAIQATVRSNESTALKQHFPLYEGVIPGSIVSSKTESNVSKSKNDQFIIDITQPTLTAYFPSVQNNKGSAIIICPGGAYYGLSMIKEGDDVARRLNALGITAFVLKYRMPSDDTMLDKSSGPLQDVQQALAFVRQHSEQWQLNKNNIGVMGFSAGGHLAASAAVHFNQAVLPEYTIEMIKPNFQILIYPVISMAENITHKGSRNNLIGEHLTPEKIRFHSNEQQVTADTPPAFIMHATDDTAVPVENALNYYQALRAHQINTQLLILPSGGHGFGMHHSFDWFKSLTMWFENNQWL